MSRIKVLSTTIVLIILVIALFGMYRCEKHDTAVLQTVCNNRSGHTIVIKLITNNFNENEPAFCATILALYAKHPHVMDGALEQFKTIDTIASVSFEYEKKEFDAKKSGAYFVQALVDTKPIGYMSFKIQPDGSAYMRQLTVDPAAQGMGIGKLLVHSIFIVRPELQKIALTTNRANISAIGFYKHLGFTEGALISEGFDPDPKVWIGLEFIKK